MVPGALMVALGVGLLASTFLLRRPPVSRSAGLDAAFAAFFILRGVMNVRSARRIAAMGTREH